MKKKFLKGISLAPETTVEDLSYVLPVMWRKKLEMVEFIYA
jgi:hypothetical protein